MIIFERLDFYIGQDALLYYNNSKSLKKISVHKILSFECLIGNTHHFSSNSDLGSFKLQRKKRIITH